MSKFCKDNFITSNFSIQFTFEECYCVGHRPRLQPCEVCDIAGLQPEVRHYDPHLALDGGEDGLQFYRLLAAEGQSRLKPGGKLMAEFGDGQESAIEGLFAQAAWPNVETSNDLTGKPRIVIASAGQ